jgi:hypothetical protein
MDGGRRGQRPSLPHNSPMKTRSSICFGVLVSIAFRSQYLRLQVKSKWEQCLLIDCLLAPSY